VVLTDRLQHPYRMAIDIDHSFAAYAASDFRTPGCSCWGNRRSRGKARDLVLLLVSGSRLRTQHVGVIRNGDTR